MSEFRKIIYIPDLLSPTLSRSNVILDLIREPIKQACNLDIFNLLEVEHTGRSTCNFNLEKFKNLIQDNTKYLAPEALWRATYHQMPQAAVDYFLNSLPPSTLLLSYEIPPWLRHACTAHNLYFLDLRCSPLRFGQDLYIATNTNNPALLNRLQQNSISTDELRLEAALLGANLRAHRNLLKEKMRNIFDLSNTLIYIPQPPNDPSLISEEGRLLQESNFSEKIKKLAAGKQVLVMADFVDRYMHRIAKHAIEQLYSIIKKPIRPCPQNSYQILSANENLELFGINSPSLQEAMWFNKKATNLAQYFTPLTDINSQNSNNYLQIHFKNIITPSFWHKIFAPDAPPPRSKMIEITNKNLGREILNEWGDYEKVMNWERVLKEKAFDRSGGIVIRRRLDALEKQLLQSESSITPSGTTATKTRIQDLRNTKIGQTAYILGNAPSLFDLDINKLMQRESFWFNKSFTLRQQGFDFHPKYYFARDITAIQQWTDEIINFKADFKFFGRMAYDYIEKILPDTLNEQNIIALEVNQTPGNRMYDDETNFSYDPSKIVYCGHTSVLDAVQVAFYMGYARVLIGGVDLDYSQPYFYGEMAPHRNGLRDLIPEAMRQSFVTARKHFEKNGRILAKITKSPHLPLEYIEATDVYKNDPLTKS